MEDVGVRKNWEVDKEVSKLAINFRDICKYNQSYLECYFIVHILEGLL